MYGNMMCGRTYSVGTHPRRPRYAGENVSRPHTDPLDYTTARRWNYVDKGLDACNHDFDVSVGGDESAAVPAGDSLDGLTVTKRL